MSLAATLPAYPLPESPDARAAAWGTRAERFARRADSATLLGSTLWRVEALRDHRDGRANPHLHGLAPWALSMWRADVRLFLRELVRRGIDIREECS